MLKIAAGSAAITMKDQGSSAWTITEAFECYEINISAPDVQIKAGNTGESRR